MESVAKPERVSRDAEEVPRKKGAGGRKRDASRDTAILDAAIETLADMGYDRMTMDMVAARAKAGKATVYRRWQSKIDMVVDAVTHMGRKEIDVADLPDTGSLRGDMLALFKPKSSAELELKLRAMAGLVVLMSQQEALADAGHQAVIGPWIEANRILIRRSIERGETRSGVDVETLATIIPSMAAYQSFVQRRPFERAFLESLLDTVLLPALGASSPRGS